MGCCFGPLRRLKCAELGGAAQQTSGRPSLISALCPSLFVQCWKRQQQHRCARPCGARGMQAKAAGWISIHRRQPGCRCTVGAPTTRLALCRACPDRVQLECHYGIKSQNPSMAWLLRPTFPHGSKCMNNTSFGPKVHGEDSIRFTVSQGLNRGFPEAF